MIRRQTTTETARHAYDNRISGRRLTPTKGRNRMMSVFGVRYRCMEEDKGANMNGCNHLVRPPS